MIVAYLRVSTDGQDVANQHFEIDQYLKAQDKAVDRVVEETVSGRKSLDVRLIGKLVTELRPGDTLIVSEVSRLSRRLTDIFVCIQKLVDAGVTLIAVKQNYVFADDVQSKMVAFAFGIAAEIERDLISQRTKQALARKRAEGVVLGRPVGTNKLENLKLHGKDDEIVNYMDANVPMAAVARLLGVNRETLRSYVSRQDLRRVVMNRRWDRTLQREAVDNYLTDAVA